MAGPLERRIAETLEENVAVTQALIAESIGPIRAAADALSGALLAGRKVLVAGNGGSAAEAQHFAAELVGRFLVERRPLPAIALTTDTSILTSLLNDYGAEMVFSRQVEALASTGDVLLALSTSGESANVLAAVEAARRASVTTIALTGPGGRLGAACDLAICVESTSVPRIQEAHSVICHILCDAVEQAVTAN